MKSQRKLADLVVHFLVAACTLYSEVDEGHALEKVGYAIAVEVEVVVVDLEGTLRCQEEAVNVLATVTLVDRRDSLGWAPFLDLDVELNVAGRLQKKAAAVKMLKSH